MLLLSIHRKDTFALSKWNEENLAFSFASIVPFAFLSWKDAIFKLENTAAVIQTNAHCDN